MTLRELEASMAFDTLMGSQDGHMALLLLAGGNWLHKFLRKVGFSLIASNLSTVQAELISGYLGCLRPSIQESIQPWQHLERGLL